MFLSLLFLHTHHHSHPPTKRKYNHPGHSPLLTCANTNTSHLSTCGRYGCAPPYAPPPTRPNTPSRPLPATRPVSMRHSVPPPLVPLPPPNTRSHNPEPTYSPRVCASPARARALGLPRRCVVFSDSSPGSPLPTRLRAF